STFVLNGATIYYNALDNRGSIDLSNGGELVNLPAPSIPGDASRDGYVNEMDAQALAAHWGQPGDWEDGDFDGDTVVGPKDASIMAANWGYGMPAEQGNQSSAVPEPGVLVMLLIGVSMLLVRRGRRYQACSG
ncbi:MAG TPA: hypothetical protein DD670_06920, partial [Planctomycetaceae bacterium]|nr:hypothetical protein [Planctomycetaceae bacterium]